MLPCDTIHSNMARSLTRKISRKASTLAIGRDSEHGSRAMRDPAYAAFSALDPFFDIVRQGLAGLVDGDHYFHDRSRCGVRVSVSISGLPNKARGPRSPYGSVC